MLFTLALVDYLTVSFKEVMDPDFFVRSLFGQGVDWQKKPGKFGYTEALFFGNIWVMHRKMDRGFEMCVDMSGTGCRAFESLKGEGFQWADFLDGLCAAYDPHFSRLDVALDLTEKWVPPVRTICKYVADRRYVSKYRRNIYTLGSEEFAFFGSPHSDVRLRIYNKALERGYSDQHWVRFEYQLRNDAAGKFVKEFLKHRNIGYCLRSCLNNAIRFTREPCIDTTNRVRLKNVQWWERLMSGADKISLFECVGLEYNLSRLEKYLVTQVAPSLYTYLRCCGGDLTHLLEAGKFRLNQRQSNLIDQFAGDFDV